MRHRTACIALTALLAWGIAGVAMGAPCQGTGKPQPAVQSAQPTQPTADATHQHDQGVAPAHQHSQTPASDAEIDQLLARLNESQGDARIAIMADLIARLVQERKAPQTPGGGQAMCPMCASMGSSGTSMCGMMDQK